VSETFSLTTTFCRWSGDGNSQRTYLGWLEGYLLTGRHGFFSCYEAFIHIVDSMFNQHAKWLQTSAKDIPWRRSIASLNTCSPLMFGGKTTTVSVTKTRFH